MYARKKKGVNKKVIFAIVLLAVIVVAVASVVIFSSQNQSQKNNPTGVIVGVKVGDYFTYSLTGEATGPVPSTVTTDFSIYNDTSYYKVTVTAINGTTVYLDTDWVFLNGTTVNSPQTIDLASGIMSDQNGFYGLYPADMKVNETIYPHVYQDVWVNGTQPITWSSGVRETNYYTTSSLLYYSLDPTMSTQCSTYDDIAFDKTTGILTSLVAISDYNNPELQTTIIWSLTDTNAWQV